MRIHTASLAPDLTVTLTGDEPWLTRLYADFPLGDGAAKLTGSLHLELLGSGDVMVRGSVTYAPIVACARCDRAIPWPLSLEIATLFKALTDADQPREKNLSPADLETYFLEDQSVDLELLLNDAVQTALPHQLLAVDEDDRCRVCHADLTSNLVFGEGSREAPSPFAALKGLKVPPQ